MFNWLTTRLKRYALKQRRSFLEAEFHKNTRNPIRRTIVGLELLTEPLEYNTNQYMPLSVRGKLELRISNFDKLYDRLEFFTREYSRAINGSSQSWANLPDSLDKKKDMVELRWLDNYFGTDDQDAIRSKLRNALELIVLYQTALTGNESPEQDVLANQTAHIFRELDTVVEHYI